VLYLSIGLILNDYLGISASDDIFDMLRHIKDGDSARVANVEGLASDLFWWGGEYLQVGICNILCIDIAAPLEAGATDKDVFVFEAREDGARHDAAEV